MVNKNSTVENIVQSVTLCNPSSSSSTAQHYGKQKQYSTVHSTTYHSIQPPAVVAVQHIMVNKSSTVEYIVHSDTHATPAVVASQHYGKQKH